MWTQDVWEWGKLNADKGVKILRTSFMDGPLGVEVIYACSLKIKA